MWLPKALNWDMHDTDLLDIEALKSYMVPHFGHTLKQIAELSMSHSS